MEEQLEEIRGGGEAELNRIFLQAESVFFRYVEKKQTNVIYLLYKYYIP